MNRTGRHMFAVRFIVLAFLAFYSYSMGRQIGGLNAFGEVVAFSAVVFIPAFYLLPTYEAWLRKHENLASVALLNVFLGWTLFGWVGALVWAFKRQPAKAATPYAPMFEPVKKTKQCPFCAEDVMLAAVKCKHCGSDLAAT
jgi:hypothetical protein